MTKIQLIAGAVIASMAAVTPVLAADPSELGKSLTPFGAEKAGSADGAIPAWDGGLTTPPAGYQPGQHYVDPYGSDHPLFTITGDTVDKYADKLMPGTIAKLKAYLAFKIMVYPTHRSFSAPQYIYDAAIANARTAKLGADGESPEGSVNAIPFPLAADAGAQGGVEAIENHILRWRGTQVKAHIVAAAVAPGGSFAEQKIDVQIIIPYAQQGLHSMLNSHFRAETVAPAEIAGHIVAVQEYIDPVKEPRLAWTYDAGQRHVRRAPEISYDNPIAAVDGLATTDDIDMFNGVLDRFDWRLIGKREVYVPYNDYTLQDPKYQYGDLVQPLTLNAEPQRWELHWVYVVEATLKSGKQHVYQKRVYAIDEDSWTILLGDLYDAHGQLWRTAANYTINYYDAAIIASVGIEYDDLQARRYAIFGLFNQDPVPSFTSFIGFDLMPGDFQPNDSPFRRMGH